MYVFWIIMLVLLTVGIVMLLHRRELKSRREIIDKSAPLAAVDLSFPASPAEPAPVPARTPDSVGEPQSPTGAPVAERLTEGSTEGLAKGLTKELTEGLTRAPGEPKAAPPEAPAPDTEKPDNWQERVKRLRERNDTDSALKLCEQQFPRIQAFQQAALVLRQRIRGLIDENRPATAELRQLYRIAVMADLYRSSNPHKPHKPSRTLHALQDLDFDYQSIGSRHLRLLTKSDIRHLEQLWGRARTHQHAEQALGSTWLALCG